MKKNNDKTIVDKEIVIDSVKIQAIDNCEFECNEFSIVLTKEGFMKKNAINDRGVLIPLCYQNIEDRKLNSIYSKLQRSIFELHEQSIISRDYGYHGIQYNIDVFLKDSNYHYEIIDCDLNKNLGYFLIELLGAAERCE